MTLILVYFLFLFSIFSCNKMCLKNCKPLASNLLGNHFNWNTSLRLHQSMNKNISYTCHMTKETPFVETKPISKCQQPSKKDRKRLSKYHFSNEPNQASRRRASRRHHQQHVSRNDFLKIETRRIETPHFRPNPTTHDKRTGSSGRKISRYGDFPSKFSCLWPLQVSLP